MPTYDVYRNLHAKSPDETWSVIDRSTGRVVCRTGHLNLTGVALVVQPAGARRVYETQVKSVHAFVRIRAKSWNDAVAEGEGFANDGNDIEWRATYRPKQQWDSFRYVEGPREGQPVHFAEFAILNNQGKMYIR